MVSYTPSYTPDSPLRQHFLYFLTLPGRIKPPRIIEAQLSGLIALCVRSFDVRFVEQSEHGFLPCCRITEQGAVGGAWKIQQDVGSGRALFRIWYGNPPSYAYEERIEFLGTSTLGRCEQNLQHMHAKEGLCDVTPCDSFDIGKYLFGLFAEQGQPVFDVLVFAGRKPPHQVCEQAA